MAEFSLRPMEPSDGPAIDALLRTETATIPMALSTHYRHDVYQSLLAQHPTLFGVVATAPGLDGLVGMATAFIEEVNAGGRLQPRAHLENLKVRHDVRRQGLGGRLAEWRIAGARRRFGGDGVVTTEVDATNAASLATAKRWSSQLLGPVRVVIARVATRPPRATNLTVRPISHYDLPAIVDAVNAFHEGYELFPRQTTDTLAAYIGPTSIGEPVRQYRVVTADDGTLVAGAAVTERFKLMTDHIERVPRPVELLARVGRMFPADRTIRTIELSLAWHAPGHVAAARYLWDAVRFEWRAQATHVASSVDERGSLGQAFHVGPTIVPRVDIMVPVLSAVQLDESRPVYVWR